MAQKLHVESRLLDRPPNVRWFRDTVILSSDATRERQDFVSKSVKQYRLQVCHRCAIVLFALEQLAEMDRANALHLNENFILNFLKMTFKRFWW